jgi:hypothetical protein
MKRTGIVTLVLGIYALHQDFWFWRASEPRLFGFLPPGLWYHGAYTLAISALMVLLIRVAWPSELERRAESSAEEDR